jgi:DNA-binding HxlR family transcriptional regulator
MDTVATLPPGSPDPDCPVPGTCPVNTTLEAIGGKWKPVVIFHLTPRPRRFNEMRRLMPRITQRMLTATLRELEQSGIVHRTVHAHVPPHVEYALTPRCRSLRPIMNAMAIWGSGGA